MLNTLSTQIADNPLAPPLDRGRDFLHNAGSAFRRAVSGFAFVGALGVTSTLLGPSGLPVACALAMLAIGLEFLTVLRRRHHH